MRSPNLGKAFPARRDPAKRYVAASPCAKDGTFERYSRNDECCACCQRRVRKQYDKRFDTQTPA